jgi:hypothetical protein
MRHRRQLSVTQGWRPWRRPINGSRYVGNPTHQFKAPGRLFTFVLDGNAEAGSGTWHSEESADGHQV